VSADKNWPRWIFASVSKSFESKRDGVNFYVEGDSFDPSTVKSYFEFRMNGPSCWELPGNVWYFKFEVNILVVHKRAEDENIHRLSDLIGIATTMFERNIPIMKYGEGVDDNREVLFDCAILTNDDSDEPVSITQLGQVDPNFKEMQAMVEGTYKIYHEV
jgi:hypothetical protein